MKQQGGIQPRKMCKMLALVDLKGKGCGLYGDFIYQIQKWRTNRLASIFVCLSWGPKPSVVNPLEASCEQPERRSLERQLCMLVLSVETCLYRGKRPRASPRWTATNRLQSTPSSPNTPIVNPRRLSDINSKRTCSPKQQEWCEE
jgi:hypothetical protein